MLVPPELLYEATTDMHVGSLEQYMTGANGEDPDTFEKTDGPFGFGYAIRIQSENEEVRLAAGDRPIRSFRDTSATITICIITTVKSTVAIITTTTIASITDNDNKDKDKNNYNMKSGNK